MTTYIDYGDKESQDQANVRNTFEFPLYIDFEAPVVTDVVYRTEYDRTTKKTKLFADLNIYEQSLRHERTDRTGYSCGSRVRDIRSP